jgi:hypothetical protein
MAGSRTGPECLKFAFPEKGQRGSENTIESKI